MTAKQEIIMTLFTEETISKVKEQFKSGNEIVSFESYNMNFRLYRPTSHYINLELFTHMAVGEQELNRLGGMRRAVMFLKPIGFFNKMEGNSSRIEVTVLKEFEDDLITLIRLGKVPSEIKVNQLSLEANALLAAFSVEALIHAEEHQDCSFQANGLDVDIYMTYDNEYPQSFLDDKYGLQGHIGAYFLKGEDKRIDVNMAHKDLYWHLHNMSLMTAYKRI